jgi:hypothetical protein
MCGATDCDACYGKREPEVEPEPECEECGETAQDRHYPGLRVLITIEEMGGRMLCNGCREARALCDECGALVLNADYDDDGRCPKCAQARALELTAPGVRAAVALVRLAADFGVDLARVNFAQVQSMLERAREFDAASRAYLHVDAVALSRRTTEEAEALGAAYRQALVSCAIAATSVAAMHDAKAVQS